MSQEDVRCMLVTSLRIILFRQSTHILDGDVKGKFHFVDL